MYHSVLLSLTSLWTGLSNSADANLGVRVRVDLARPQTARITLGINLHARLLRLRLVPARVRPDAMEWTMCRVRAHVPLRARSSPCISCPPPHQPQIKRSEHAQELLVVLETLSSRAANDGGNGAPLCRKPLRKVQKLLLLLAAPLHRRAPGSERAALKRLS
jgi:hypothetical protein